MSNKNLLTKGQRILFSEKKDSVILKAEDVALEQKLQILLQDGQLKVKVEEKRWQLTAHLRSRRPTLV